VNIRLFFSVMQVYGIFENGIGDEPTKFRGKTISG
jgi:hypothetical protein